MTLLKKQDYWRSIRKFMENLWAYLIIDEIINGTKFGLSYDRDGDTLSIDIFLKPVRVIEKLELEFSIDPEV